MIEMNTHPLNLGTATKVTVPEEGVASTEVGWVLGLHLQFILMDLFWGRTD
jgi:hypothetical protein